MRRRVAQLNYAIAYPSNTVSVSPTAEPITVQFGDFSCAVSVEQLVATPGTDFESADDARAVLEPYLDAWAASTELFDRCPMTFSSTNEVYEQLDTGNRDIAYADVAAGTAIAWTATAHVQHGQIPRPRPGVSIEGPLAAQLRRRWQRMEQGGEPVPAASYYVATAVKQYYKPEDLNVSGNVIGELQRLASVADPDVGRKADGHPGPLTSDDLAWMRAACRALVQRVLEVEAGADFSQTITRTDVLP